MERKIAIRLETMDKCIIWSELYQNCKNNDKWCLSAVFVDVLKAMRQFLLGLTWLEWSLSEYGVSDGYQDFLPSSVFMAPITKSTTKMGRKMQRFFLLYSMSIRMKSLHSLD